MESRAHKINEKDGDEQMDMRMSHSGTSITLRQMIITIS